MSEQDRLLIFDRNFLEDLAFWAATDRRTTVKIFDLIESTRRDPFAGLGKPEPLRHLGSGVWSRRITLEHRLVYRVQEGKIYFAQARYHYG